MKDISTSEMSLDKIKTLVHALLIVILLGCMLNMPYGYYQLVRVVSFVGFSFLSYLSWKDQRPLFLLLFAVGAITFNPIEKLYLGKELWIVVDIIFSLILAYSLLTKRTKN